MADKEKFKSGEGRDWGRWILNKMKNVLQQQDYPCFCPCWIICLFHSRWRKFKYCFLVVIFVSEKMCFYICRWFITWCQCFEKWLNLKFIMEYILMGSECHCNTVCLTDLFFWHCDPSLLCSLCIPPPSLFFCACSDIHHHITQVAHYSMFGRSCTGLLLSGKIHVDWLELGLFNILSAVTICLPACLPHCHVPLQFPWHTM